MTKLTYFKRDTIKILKHDLDEILYIFSLDTPICKLEEKYNSKLFFNTRYECPDIELLDNVGNCVKDIDAIKLVYGNMKDLPLNLASEECLWSALCLSDKFWTYTKKRWDIKDEQTRIKDKTSLCNKIKDRIFFGRAPHTHNALARLWWLGKLTYDEKADDPYQTTAFVLRNADYIAAIFERSQGYNKELVKFTCLRLIELEKKEGLKIDQSLIRELFKYLNAYGGSVLIDSLTDNINLIIDKFLIWYQKEDNI